MVYSSGHRKSDAFVYQRLFFVILNIYLPFQVNSCRASLVIVAEIFLKALHKFDNFTNFHEFHKHFRGILYGMQFPEFFMFEKKKLNSKFSLFRKNHKYHKKFGSMIFGMQFSAFWGITSLCLEKNY